MNKENKILTIFYSKFFIVFCIIALLALFAAISIVSYFHTRDYRIIKQISYYDEDFSWLALNLEAELGRLSNSVLKLKEDSFSKEPQNAARQELHFRMSIVESRVSVLTEGQFAIWATSNSEANKKLLRIKQKILEIRNALSLADYHVRLSSEINAAQTEARRLTMLALRHERHERETVFSELDAQHSFGLFMGYAAVTTFLFAVIVILIQWKKRDRYEHELIIIDEKLKQTVLKYEYFIRITSHELRNSAQAINAMLDREFFITGQIMPSSIADSLRSFNENVLSLLDFAKILSGNTEYKGSKTDIKSTVEAWASATFLGSVIDYELNIADGMPKLFLQRVVFFRVLSNIMLNAERHAQRRVVIDVNLERSSRTVQIDVHDDGAGFTKAAKTNFYAGASNLEAELETGGMGIGLIVSQQILNSVGGGIEIIGSRYGGASVRVIIPYEVSHSTDDTQDFAIPFGQKRDMRRAESPRTTKRILYCEDNPQVFEPTFSLLSESFDLVEGAQTIEECIYFLNSEKFDVVLMDYNLGGRSAEEIIKLIKQDSIDIKIIIVTGMSKERMKEIRGVDKILYKPVKFEEIKLSLEETLQIMSMENEATISAFAITHEKKHSH